MRRGFVLTLVSVALFLSSNVSADNGAALLEFDNAEQETLYQGLVRELRCTVCQNQTLLDSNSGLAQDLRQNVYNQVRAGATRESVVDFMVSRYGEFVLYRPPFKSETWLLWLGPLLFLAIGGAIVAFVVRQQSNRQDDASTSIAPNAATLVDQAPHKTNRRGK